MIVQEMDIFDNGTSPDPRKAEHLGSNNFNAPLYLFSNSVWEIIIVLIWLYTHYLLFYSDTIVHAVLPTDFLAPLKVYGRVNFPKSFLCFISEAFLSCQYTDILFSVFCSTFLSIMFSSLSYIMKSWKSGENFPEYSPPNSLHASR